MDSSELSGVSYNDFLSLDLVPQISARVPNGFVGLRVSAPVRRANGNLIPAGVFWTPRELPCAERVGSEVFAQAGVMPVRPVVVGYFNFLDTVIPAECDSLKQQGEARGNFV